ncbi:MAG TPA: hypothetical protein PKC28_01255, partial [Bdellovibrionales bacterium]|nr:hypothetical protein [Bdellovibrionales bacterium]
IYAALGPFTYQTHELTHDFESPFTGSLALIVEGDIDHNGGPEVSVFYMRKAFSIVQDGKMVTERAQKLYIGTGYRHWFTSWLSGAISFVSGYSMGDAEVKRDDFAPRAAPATSARDATDYGFEASIQSEVWREGAAGIIIDGRYMYSITPSKGEDSNHYGVLFAYKYRVQ